MTEKKKDTITIDAQEMFGAGLLFGHKTSKTHPKMKPYLASPRSGVSIVDLEKTKVKLEEALKFIEEIVASGKTLLMVGTKIQAKNLLKEVATECGVPFVSERWLGGTLTNFETILKRTAYFKDLVKKKETGELEKYTKKEKAHFIKEIADLESKFGGIKDMDKVPDAIFVCDTIKDELVIKEARIKEIPLIAIVDTNADPTLIDYPIPANDDAVSSITYILGKVKDTILKTKKIEKKIN